MKLSTIAFLLSLALLVILVCFTSVASAQSVARDDDDQDEDSNNAALTTLNTPYMEFGQAVKRYTLERAVHLFAPEQPGAEKKCSMPPDPERPDTAGHDTANDGRGCLRVRLTTENYCCWRNRDTVNDPSIQEDDTMKGLLPIECCRDPVKYEREYNRAECRMILGRICELLDAIGAKAANDL